MCVHVNRIQPWDEVIVMLYKDEPCNWSCNMEIRRESDGYDYTASFNCKDLLVQVLLLCQPRVTVI